jgi:hypothetical protein
MRARRSVQKGMLALASAALLFFAVEGAASLLVAVREARWDLAGADAGSIEEEQHCEYDADLGWMNIRGRRFDGLYGPGTSFTTNAQGLRATREYAPEVPEGRYRVICLGDSFTMGYGVGDADTFPALLEAGSERLEVVNMGLGGFGIDQDYLWYLRDGARLEAQLLLLLVIPDDFNRVLTDRFMGLHAKPRLAVEGGELVVHNVPVPQGFAASRSARLARAVAERLGVARLFAGAAERAPEIGDGPLPFTQVSERILQALRDAARAKGQDFAVVYLPPGPLMVRSETPMPVVRWLESFCTGAGIPYYDLTPSFRRIAPEELAAHFAHDHYSPRGNQVVAEALAAIIAADFDR